MYKYKVSIIVPVFNAEESLEQCFNSLLIQTYGFQNIEVILVDNLSTDSSKEICLGYAYEFDNVKFYQEACPGVAYARNTGLDHADGKYIMFVDSDDYISKNAVKAIISFFEKHEQEIDLVTYYEKKTVDGKDVREHVRFKYLTSTGIYDLDDTYFALQVRINICIKNGLNIKFDTSMNFQEDQKFCHDILSAKKRLGYVKEAIYYYNVNSLGLVSQYSSPAQYFEVSTSFFEKLFYNTENVSKYEQALFLHDCIWKFKNNQLWPYHFSADKLNEAKQRIKNLLHYVDDDVILSYPEIDSYEKVYWLRLKDDADITYIVSENGVALIKNNNIFYQRRRMEIILMRLQILNNKYKLRAFLKSTVFQFSKMPECTLLTNGQGAPVKLTDCASGYYKSKEKTNVFWGFEIEGDVESSVEIKIEVSVDGVMQPMTFYNMPGVEFSNNCKSYLSQNILIEQTEDTIKLTELTSENFIKQRKKILDLQKDAATKKYKAQALQKIDRKIWLYTDAPSVVCDNAFLQFQHDITKDDEVERYYVITNEKINDIINGDFDYNKLVKDGSEKHIDLFFKAEKIFTSFIDEEVIWPFKDKKTRKIFRGNFNAEVIYLQHGVLHAHLPWYYSKYRTNIDKFVVSTAFEKENLIQNYDYEDSDIITTGMARFDVIDKTAVPERKILFAPSWRSYLVNQAAESDIHREANELAFLNSSYFKNISAFLMSEELQNLLEQKGICLEIKMHPEFELLYGDVLDQLTSEQIHIANHLIHPEEYCALITDFSSILYDFVYLGRPILYFIPDLEEFLCGMNHYRDLDLPLEQGFGPCTDVYQELNGNLEELANRNFTVAPQYADRYSGFFPHMDSTREALYDVLCENE